MARPTISPVVFDALAKLTRMRQSQARAAARLVMVDGLTQCLAAAQIGISQQTVSAACMRLWLVRADAMRATR
jgi:hypothetical protein